MKSSPRRFCQLGLQVVTALLVAAAAQAQEAPRVPGPSSAGAAPVTQTWRFQVLLADSPIGLHQFTVTRKVNEIQVSSSAEFAVKVLGLTIYRYQQNVQEQWRDGCLVAMNASTNDNGTPLQVSADWQGNSLHVQGPEGARQVEGCTFSYAYWNPALLGQNQLLNPQTGKIDLLRVARLASPDAAPAPLAPHAGWWRLHVEPRPIDIQLGADGQWQGLQALVKGGRTLTYRKL